MTRESDATKEKGKEGDQGTRHRSVSADKSSMKHRDAGLFAPGCRPTLSQRGVARDAFVCISPIEVPRNPHLSSAPQARHLDQMLFPTCAHPRTRTGRSCRPPHVRSTQASGHPAPERASNAAVTAEQALDDRRRHPFADQIGDGITPTAFLNKIEGIINDAGQSIARATFLQFQWHDGLRFRFGCHFPNTCSGVANTIPRTAILERLGIPMTPVTA